MDIYEINIKEIRPDFFFRFTGDRDRNALIRSVQRSGILTPLPVLAVDDVYRMIGGFGRWETAMALGVDLIPVRKLDSGIPLWMHMMDEVTAHWSIRPFNLVEKARLMTIFEGLEMPETDFNDQLLPLLELPAKPLLLEQVRTVLTLDDSVQAYIEKHNLSLKQVDMFRNVPVNGQTRLMEAADTMQIRGVELASIIDMCRDVSGRENVPWDDLVQETVSSVEEPDWTANQRRQHWKENLMQRACPYISEQNEGLETLRQALKIPEGGGVKWDTKLERPGLTLKMILASPERLHTFVHWLGDPLSQQHLKDMIDRLK